MPLADETVATDEYLNVREVAALLRLKERKIYDLVREGRIPCVKVTGKWLFPRAKVKAWLAAGDRAAVDRPQADRPERSELLHGLPAIVAGSRDPLLDWCLAESGSGLALVGGGSLAGLDRLAAGEASAAAVHLLDPETGIYNVPYVMSRLADQDIVVLEWARREQGLVVAPGNPLGLTDPASLIGRRARVALRQPEAGSHILLKHRLEASGHGLDELAVAGDLCRTGLDVGLRVLDGRADAGLAIRAVARQLRLDFLPVAWERFDLVVSRRAYFEPGFQRLFRFARTAEAQEKADDLQGYDLSHHAEVHWNAP